MEFSEFIQPGLIVPFWTTLEAEKIDARKKKPEANFFGSEGFNSTKLFWILKTQKTLAEGFFFLKSHFWSWKGVQNGLFLYRITFLPCSYEAKVKNKNFLFPREEKFLFFPVSPKTKKIGAGKKSDPLYRKTVFWGLLLGEFLGLGASNCPKTVF